MLAQAGRLTDKADNRTPELYARSPAQLRVLHPRRSTVHTDAQMGPPMLNVAATRGFGTCSAAGTLPSNCHAAHPTIATPVAPIG